MMSNLKYKLKNYTKSIKIIFSIVIIVSASRNLDRLVDENRIYGFNPIKSPFYNIEDSFFTMRKNKKIFFYDTSICEEENSIKDLKCKKLIGYNFYYK